MKTYTVEQLYKTNVINPSFQVTSSYKKERKLISEKLNQAIRERKIAEDVKIRTSRPYVFASILQTFFRDEMRYL
jgi:hypothetical protein